MIILHRKRGLCIIIEKNVRGGNSMRQSKLRRTLALVLSAALTMNGMGISPVSAATTNEDSRLTTNIKAFSFGTDQVEGYTKITKENIYNTELGYGFSTNEYLDEATGWQGGVYYPRTVKKTQSDTSYVTEDKTSLSIGSKVWTETEESGYGVYTYENTSTFDIDLEPKDYTVNVELINPTSSAITVNLEAEDITKVSNIEIQPGATVQKSYTACLVDGQLNLKFLAASTATKEADAVTKEAYVSKITLEENTRQAGEKPTIFIASDSTVQTYDSGFYPQTGWGQVLYNFFEGADQVKEYECTDCNYSQSQTYETSAVTIENRAIGGRSSKSFIEEGKLDDLLEDVKPGDFVLVQWAHNDATAARPNRYVPVSDFEDWLQYYVDGVEQRGGTCVLVTPVARRSYTETDGVASFKSDFDAYRQVMLQMAEQKNIPLLDLTKASIELCNKYGAEGSKSLFLWLNAGDYTGYYAGGVSDSTHLQYYGAYKFAQCVSNLIRDYDKDLRLEKLQSIIADPVQYDKTPVAPTGIESVTIGASSISMKWDSQDDAELYYIYRHELQDGETIENVSFNLDDKYSVSSVTKYTDTNCTGGKTYVYAIAGFNELGVGELSEKSAFTTKSALYKYDFCQAASNPTMNGWLQVTSSQMYSSNVGYGWITAPGNGRYRAGNNKPDSNDMTDDFCLGNGEFAVDLPNGDYEVKITAADLMAGTSTIKPSYTAEGNSIGGISCKQSAGTVSATVRVMDGQLNITVGGTNPYINGLEITPISLAPTGLLYQELSFEGENANFLLSWNEVEGAQTYRVYRKSESDSSFSLHKIITKEEKDNSTTLPFTADLGETYEYYVTAVLADEIETAPSNTIKIVMLDENGEKPVAPSGLDCVVKETQGIQLSWSKVNGAFKYILYRSEREEGDKGFTEYKKIGETRELVYLDQEVTSNINWYYKVQAVGAAGAGELSQSVKTPITTSLTQSKAESLLDRALVAVNLAGDDGVGVDENGKTGTNNSSASQGVYLSWRLFEADSSDVRFTIYKNGQMLETALSGTNYIDKTGTADDKYQVVGSTDQALGLTSQSVATWQNKYIEMELDTPEDQELPDGTSCYYTANDMTVADLDGDGQYELVVKWAPSTSKDNSQSGYTGNTILDAYDIDANSGSAKRMWRIDLGVNIRSGAHYTQFQVWDMDGDGKAEVLCKTADGTTDGQGTCIGDGSKDYRNTSGYILEGPEFLSIFNGQTGAVMDTIDYKPARGNVSAWGDAYGNRVDRFLSCIAYLDGQRPSAVFCRGYYTRTCLVAYDFINGKLVERWSFDSDIAGQQYESQGNHGISVADIDQDQKDEIIYGALVLDHDGSVKYSTGLGHGDAMHVSDWMPSNDGLEVFSVHEHADAQYQVELHDAETGKILFGYYTGKDTGRGMAADVDPTAPGAEFWANAEWNGTDGGMYSSASTFDKVLKLSNTTPSVNFSIFWDGDLLSELQDHTFNNAGTNYHPVSTNITKWDYESQQSVTIFESSEIATSNGTKGNLGLVADVLGDWREEIIARSKDQNNKIRIYTTTLETNYSIPCLMEDHQYRIGVAWQNVAYNQPAHLSYLLSEGVITAQPKVEETTTSKVTLSWTAASDGVYGHAIDGYNIYRSLAEQDNYELVGTVEAGTLEYVDTTVQQNTEYEYKIAAIVDGESSYRSVEVKATTALDIKTVIALDSIELVQDTKGYEEAFPSTVSAIDQSGNRIDDIEIVWNLNDFDISKVGIVTVYGTINGYDTLVPIGVNVVANVSVGYVPLDDVYAIVGNPPVLPESVEITMKNGTTVVEAVDWDMQALNYNQVGEYTLTGTTALLKDIILKVYIKENYIVSVEHPGLVEIMKGKEAILPDTVWATYADGKKAEVNVKWDKIDTNVVGLVICNGTVQEYAQKVEVKVNVIKEPMYRFDFGINSNTVGENWTGITVNAKGGKVLEGYNYTQERGYGFTDVGADALTSAMEGRNESYIYDGVLPTTVYNDFVLPAGKEFKVDLPNGFYTVEVVAGSYYKSSVVVSIEGAANTTISNAAQSYTIYKVEGVEVTDGQMNFVFPAGTYRMNAIMITSEAEEEIEDPTRVEVTPDYKYLSTWGQGSIGTMTVTNTTGVDFYNGWTLEFDCERPITSVWGATLLSKEENHYIITNPVWNKELLQGESVSIGFSTGDASLSGEINNCMFTNIQLPEEVEDTSTVAYEFHYSADWGIGAAGSITITNTTDQDFETGWTVEFDYTREIQVLFNGTVKSNSDGHYVIQNPFWNKKLKKGESITISFLAGEGSKLDQIRNVSIR